MRPFLVLPLLLGFCQPDETISGHSDRGAVWHLVELNGEPFDAPATLSFPEEGIARGQGPCNTFRATQAAPYPWIEIRGIAATRMACSDLDAETAYFAALREATLVEASPRILLLTTEDGMEAVFTNGPPAD
ncbi:META domain-containing protein [Jannaschia sp. LMIT008]|uniref:META domain-containing protein n=1 Tax=Jannaschia maritima TaxID=3032585 RepID=UPI0028113CFD|nr:META domain-containing protein [Jannaschia sp. LMIT008]